MLPPDPQLHALVDCVNWERESYRQAKRELVEFTLK